MSVLVMGVFFVVITCALVISVIRERMQEGQGLIEVLGSTIKELAGFLWAMI